MASARRVILQPECLDDLRTWAATEPRVAGRVLDLMEATRREPFSGIGKPEPLKHLGPDLWSRRITRQDRLVYRVYRDVVDFLQAKYHY